MMAALFAVLAAFTNPLMAATLPGKVSKAAAQRFVLQSGNRASMVNVNLIMDGVCAGMTESLYCMLVLRVVCMELSQPHGIHAFPVGAGEGGDAGVGLAEEDGTAQTAAGDDFAALGGGEGAGGGGGHEQGLHASILVAYHAAVGGGLLCGDGEAAGGVHFCRGGPEEAPLFIVVLDVRVAAVAAAVAKHWASQFLHGTHGGGYQLTAGCAGYPHLGSVDGLAYFL